jgi:hypothetical protein
MESISKFYLLDTLSPNEDVMPSASPAAGAGTVTGDAAGAATPRDATDTPGESDPDVESQITSNADTSAQLWGHRRFVSRPLAAQTVQIGTSWTFSYASSQSNTSHNGGIVIDIYFWRPSAAAMVGAGLHKRLAAGVMTATAETAFSVAGGGTDSRFLNAGDVAVFDVFSSFTQAMSTSYTDEFAYDGTTEASAITCASFVLSSQALTLYADPLAMADNVTKQLKATPSYR